MMTGLFAAAAVLCCALAAALIYEIRWGRKLMEENSGLEDKLKAQSTEMEDVKFNLRERYLKGIVQGEVPEPEKLELFLKRYDIRFLSDTFSVINMILLDESGFFSDDPTYIPDYNERKKLREVLISCFSKELENYSDFNLVLIDGSFTGILSLKATPDIDSDTFIENVRDITLKLTECVESAVKRMQEENHVTMLATVSTPYHSIYAVQKAYIEALELAERDFNGQLALCRYNVEAGEMDKAIFERHIDNERRFYNYAANREFISAGEILTEYIERNSQATGKLFSQLKKDVEQHVEFMMGVVEINWHSSVPDGTELLRAVYEVSGSISTDELSRWVTELSHRLQSYWEACNQDISQRSLNIKRYIEENYSDPSLNVPILCERFGISQAYLSRTFKQQVGFGVLDYIHRTRIAAAKKLLASDMTINDISEQVGYYSRRALTDAFKRIEGVTPDAWRKNML